jgi:predicted alpha/beta hydrolase
MLCEQTIVTSDGQHLGATIFGGRERPALVIASAMGVRRRYYAAFAEFAFAQGFTVVTFDYRGIGGSRPPRLRGFGATLADWGEIDLDAVLRWTIRDLAPASITLVGHSVGGQIAGLADSLAHVDAIVLVAAQSGYWRHWRGFRKAGLFAFWTMLPAVSAILGFFPLGIAGGGESIPRHVAAQWARWGRKPRYVIDDESLDVTHYALYDRPLLAWSFSDDHFAPPRAVDALVAAFPLARMTRRHVTEPGVGHFGFFRKGVRESLWRETLDWVSANARQ